MISKINDRDREWVALQQCAAASFTPALLIPVTRSYVVAVSDGKSNLPGTKLYINTGRYPAWTSCPDIFSRRLRAMTKLALLDQAGLVITE